MALVKEYDDLCYSRLNPDNTRVLATSPPLRKRAKEVLFDGHPLNVVKHYALSPRASSHTTLTLTSELAKALTQRSVPGRSLGPWTFRKSVISVVGNRVAPKRGNQKGNHVVVPMRRRRDSLFDFSLET